MLTAFLRPSLAAPSTDLTFCRRSTPAPFSLGDIAAGISDRIPPILGGKSAAICPHTQPRPSFYEADDFPPARHSFEVDSYAASILLPAPPLERLHQEVGEEKVCIFRSHESRFQKCWN